MKTRIVIVTQIFLLAVGFPLFGQITQTLAPATITVNGTSTMHDWEMKTSTMKGQAVFVMEDRLAAVKNLSITLPAETLKSGKDGMDKNAYKALKTSQYKNITFDLTTIKSIAGSGNSSEISAEGRLQIAGVTKVVPVKATCTADSKGGFRCQGERSFKMSDFGVEPPSFMFGTVKTGDDITIVFDISFPGNTTISNSTN